MRASGLVSVITLGDARTSSTAAERVRLDWPTDRLEAIAVHMESGEPAGRQRTRDGAITVAGGREAAAARNRGAEAASGEYLAFLDAAACPAPDWLEVAVKVLEHDRGICCVASKVVDAAGSVLSAAPEVSFDGYPTTTPQGDSSAHDVAQDALFAPAGAMVVRTDVFRGVGGFDERYERCLEDLDLGWRLWLYGHRVRYVPDAEVRWERGGAGSAGDLARDKVLRERNALFTMFKNYDDESLALALPAALLLSGRQGPPPGAAGVVDVDARAPSSYAIDEFIDALPTLTEARREVQERRQRTDPEIIRLFRHPLRCSDHDARSGAGFDAVVAALGLRGRFGVRRRIVVATADTLTRRMAGPAIRAWNIAGALSMEHDVELVTTSSRCELAHPRFPSRSVDDRELRQLERWCDVFIFQGWVMSGRPYLEGSRKIIVADIYDPLHLEQLEHGREGGEAVRRREVQGATRLLNDQVVRGDFFMCASEKQRDFWLGQMASLGRVNPVTYDEDHTLRSLIAIVPFGVSDVPPEKTAPAIKGVIPGIGLDDKVILWGGGIYNWFDPLTLIKAVDRLRRRQPDVRLFFMGLRHPNPDVPEMHMATAARALADELDLTGAHVFFNEDWVAYDQRQNYLLEADVGVSTHLDHIETAFSFRTRILDYVWTCLPIVATAGDSLAKLIEDRQLGLTVPPGDVEALEEALARVLDDETFVKTCRENISAVMPELVWSQTLQPLIDFCRSPRRAPDLVDPELSSDLSEEQAALGYGRGWWRRDLEIGVAHLRRGGMRLVVSKTKNRLRQLPGVQRRST